MKLVATSCVHCSMRIFFPLFLVACVSDPAMTADGGGDSATSTDTSTPMEDGAMTTDAKADAPACGVIGLPCCGATCGGGAVCTAGSCACQGAQMACGMSCVDLMGDAKNCGTCGHDCLGGQCTSAKCQPSTITTGQTAVSSLAVDATSIYWTRTGGQGSTVNKANLDGSSVVTLFTSTYCSDIVVDAQNTYFHCNNSIYRCAIGGCNMQATALAGPYANNVGAMALDGANNRLYFTVGTPYNTSSGGFIASIPIPNGGAHSRLVPADQPSPASIRIQNGTVFWLNSGTYTNDSGNNNGGLKRAPLGINQQETVIGNDTGTTDEYGLALDANTAFWGGGSLPQIRSVSLGGGSPATFVNAGGTVPAVIVDATDLWWVESSTGTVRRCSKGNCAPVIVASGQSGAYVIIQDAASIFWGNYTGGEIRRLAK